MNMKELASKISRQEGKKHQASVGDVREILGLVCDEIMKSPGGSLLITLCENGRRRAKRRRAK